MVRIQGEAWRQSKLVQTLSRARLSARLFVRRQKWPVATPVSDAQSGPLLLTGFLNETLGLGKGARLSLCAFQSLGIAVEAHDIRLAYPHFVKGGLVLPGDNRGVWFVQANPPETEILFASYRPDTWDRRYRIGYWAWETSEAPRAWVRTARWLDEIWTPSAYVKEALALAFLKAGRDDEVRKLKVAPHPVPLPDLKPNRRDLFAEGDTDFLALSMFDGRSTFARKNPVGAVAAWCKAFPNPRPKSRLLVKMLHPEQDPIGFSALTAAVQNRPDIRLWEADLSEENLVSLFASIDLYISLHRAEGFGLPVAEAMAAGVVVLTSDYSATAEFADGACALPVPVQVCPVSDPSGAYKVGVWGEPDLEAAANLIRQVASDKALRERLGSAARVKAGAFQKSWSAEEISRISRLLTYTEPAKNFDAMGSPERG